MLSYGVVAVRRMPGRPSKGDDARKHSLSIKFNVHEIEAMTAAAAACGKTLREWIRDHVTSLVKAPEL